MKKLTEAQRTIVRRLHPKVTEECLDYACSWIPNDQEMEDDGWDDDEDMDEAIEVEVGHEVWHIYFFQGLLQGEGQV